MDPQIVSQWFQQIQQIWAPCAGSRRIIPFCTPVQYNPPALVIGTNHSDFIDGGGVLSEQIADQFAQHVPLESTYLVHHHRFARALREVCGRAGIALEALWVGTNRCAVQTGPDGTEGIDGHENFNQCQQQMDQVLREIINVIAPCNVLLVGEYAMRLFYPDGTVGEAQPLDHETPNGRLVSIIPLYHLSRARWWQPNAERLAQWFMN